MKNLSIEDLKIGDKFICTKTQLDFFLDERIIKGKVYEIVEIDEENEEVQLNNGVSEYWPSICEYMNPFEADQNVKTEELLKISWELVYDEIQNYLMGENGCPTMGEPYRDMCGSLAFEDCEGNVLDEYDLLSWYEDLVKEGLIEDTLEIVGKNVELVDDYDIDEEEEDEDEDDY